MKAPLTWVPIFIDNWLFGSTADELTPEQESTWLRLLLLAGKDSGYIRANPSLGYPTVALAGLIRRQPELVEETIKRCIAVGKIERFDNGVLYIASWEKCALTERHRRRLESGQPEDDAPPLSPVPHSSLEENKIRKKSKGKRTYGPEKRTCDTAAVIDRWNEKGIRTLGDKKTAIREKTIKRIEATLVDYSLDVILKAVDNYAAVLGDSGRYYFRYKWDLLDFLGRGLRKFTDDADPLHNFSKDKEAGGSANPMPSYAEVQRRCREFEQRINKGGGLC